MTTLKNRTHLRLPVILGMSLMTSLLLIAGSVALHLHEFAPGAPTAHAATVRSSCASTKGTQQALCEHQDPIVQRCVTDAETLDLQTIFQDPQQTRPLGEVELRYSPACKAYWIRTTALLTSKGVFKAVHAHLVFHDQTTEDIVGKNPTPTILTAYVVWTDMTVAPMTPHAGSGSFDLVGQSHPIIVALQE